MKRAILSCNGLDKPEGSVAREVAILTAEATESEIICPVLLNRASARYKKALSDSSLIVIDGCTTRCATRLTTAIGAKIERKLMVSDAVKASGKPLGSSLRLQSNGLALAQSIVEELVRSLNAPAATPEPVAEFEAPTEYLVVTHDKFEFRIPVVDYLFNATRYFHSEGAMKLYAWMFAFAAPALGQVPHQHHLPLSSDEYARVLEDPSRDAWQKPHAVLMALDLRLTDLFQRCEAKNWLLSPANQGRQ